MPSSAVTTFSRHRCPLPLSALTMPTGMRGSKFQVTVSLLSGRSFQMTCCRSEFVDGFKKALAKQTGMDWFGQRLYYEGKELLDNETLGMAGVKRNADFALVFDDDVPPPGVYSSDD